METLMPSWLEQSPTIEKNNQPEISSTLSHRAADIALAHTVFDLIFDETIERLSSGHRMKDIVEDYNESHHPPITSGRYMTWIMKDKARKARFNEAKSIGTYVVLDEMVSISDGKDDPMEDVARTQQRIKVRHLELKAYNREVFGDDNNSHSNGGGQVSINITGVSSPYHKSPVVDITPIPPKVIEIDNE